MFDRRARGYWGTADIWSAMEPAFRSSRQNAKKSMHQDLAFVAERNRDAPPLPDGVKECNTGGHFNYLAELIEEMKRVSPTLLCC
jgi:hypothetical protein